MNDTNQIDFAIIWVDGGDEKWKSDKERYKGVKSSLVDDGEERYRDWDNLRFWFRGVEKYAPWVNKVYFITCGQVPNWLDTNHEKLVCVNHSDYMKEDYLPTFSSHPIELNLCRIKNLSEKIVYFNDDMFLISDVQPDDFFCKGKPVYTPILHAVLPLTEGNSEIMSHIYINMITTINKNFNKTTSLAKNWGKWFNPLKIGIKNSIMNVFNSQYKEFVGFGNDHLPVPLLKSTMEEVWLKEHALLDETSKRKFRSSQDVSQYLFRYWELAKGNFYPRNCSKIGRRFTVTKDNHRITDAIREQNLKMICINDSAVASTFQEFEIMKSEINAAFEKILPEKSSYEK